MERGILHNGALRHRRRISHRGLATPPVPQPPTNHEGSRFPSVPGKTTSVFSIAECCSRLIVLRSRCTTPDALPLARSLHLHRQVSNRKFPARPGSSLPRNNILLFPGHDRPAHPPKALVLSPDRRDPSCPCGRTAPPRLLFHNTLTAANTTRSSYNHSSAVVFPRGVHSTVMDSPSSPPTTVRHAPPDVEAFCATSLLPKDPASVAAPRQPSEGRHHSLSRPHTAFFWIGPNSDRQPSKTRDAPIRRGTSFRIGVPPRNSGPCTAQNLKLPPATVETKIRPPDLLSRLNDE